MSKSIALELRVWYDPVSRHIKLAGRGLTASTVSNDPASKRYHPNLYKKLARCLREAGVPAPDEVDLSDSFFDRPGVDLPDRVQPVAEVRELL